MSVSSKELEARQEVLDNLEEYINRCQEDITAMMDTLEWTPEHFMVPRKLSQCPYNKDHRMPESSLEKHKQTCEFRSQGYSKDETEQILQDTSFYYQNADCVFTVKLDKEKLNSILWKHHVDHHSVFYGFERMPQTPVEEEQLLSREDRLGLAEHIAAMAKEAHRLKDLEKSELLGAENLADLIKKDEDRSTKLDPIEEIAALRDYRRRRQTYRAKNVHITKKSHTEILREVINNQMEIYAKSLEPETSRLSQDDGVSDNRSERSKESRPRDTRNERSESNDNRYRKSRSRSRDRHKRKRSRSRSKQRDERKRSRRSRSMSRSKDERSEGRKIEEDGDQRQSRSRSPSRSSDRHKKHKKKKKHKKHKHKHKHGDDESAGIKIKEEKDSE